MISTSKNLIFTVTHGRTGTTMLTEVLKIFDDIYSAHEPEPNYATVLPQVKSDPRFAIGFLKTKFQEINQISASNYAETSNVFGKGFLIPLARMGIMPNLIFLNRNFRETAKSLYLRGSFPARTKTGRHYSADPSCSGSLPIFNTDNLTNYQLCYWGVLDSYYRQLHAQELCKAFSKKYVWTSPAALTDFDETCRMGERLGLHISDARSGRESHKRIASVHHNPNKPHVRDNKYHKVDHVAEETEVIDRIAFCEPLFIEKVRSSVFFDGSSTLLPKY